MHAIYIYTEFLAYRELKLVCCGQPQEPSSFLAHQPRMAKAIIYCDQGKASQEVAITSTLLAIPVDSYTVMDNNVIIGSNITQVFKYTYKYPRKKEKEKHIQPILATKFLKHPV